MVLGQAAPLRVPSAAFQIEPTDVAARGSLLTDLVLRSELQVYMYVLIRMYIAIFICTYIAMIENYTIFCKSLITFVCYLQLLFESEN